MKRSEAFLRTLVDAVPTYRDVLVEHVRENGEVIPHLLMADITRELLRQYDTATGGEKERLFDVRRILTLLSEAVESRDPDLRDLIFASFLENLEQDDRSAIGVRSLFDPVLSRAYEIAKL